MPAVVAGIPASIFGAHIQQSAPNGIFADRPRVGASWNASVDAGPAPAVIGGPPEVGTHVVELVTICGDVRRTGVEVRWLDYRHTREVRHVARRHVRPCLHVVAGDVNESVV